MSWAEGRRKVLIIDDSEWDRRLVGVHLRADDLETTAAADGPSGLAAAREAHPDLILLDLRLAGWNGLETLRRLKDDPVTRSIPVIFVSASTVEEKALGLDLGAVDFVDKPFEPIELRARVRAALRAKYLHDLLEERAHLDGLTGLGNRLALEDRLAADWALCRRSGVPLAVLIADLDHFKAINDAHGHPAGDEILRRSGALLRDSVRTGDFVARYGGEEFVVVAPDCDLGGGIALAERFRNALGASPIHCGGRAIRLTCSVGVASSEEALGESEVLARADEALYRAKAGGRNAVRAWTLGRLGAGPVWNPVG